MGIEAARGEKLLLLNSDIQLTPSYIKTCLDNFVDAQTFAVMGQAIDGSVKPQTTGVLYRQGLFQSRNMRTIRIMKPTLYLVQTHCTIQEN